MKALNELKKLPNIVEREAYLYNLLNNISLSNNYTDYWFVEEKKRKLIFKNYIEYEMDNKISKDYCVVYVPLDNVEETYVYLKNRHNTKNPKYFPIMESIKKDILFALGEEDLVYA